MPIPTFDPFESFYGLPPHTPILYPGGIPLPPYFPPNPANLYMPPSPDVHPPISSWIHSPQQAPKVQIRWLIRRDMPECLDIERQSFEFCWTEEDFLCCLRQRNCIGMVAEYNHRIVGFMVYELHKAKLRVLNFAVDREFRLKAVGTQMIEKLVDKLSQQRRQEIALEVRESNLSAQLFFKKMGFKAWYILHNWYENDTNEDAYFMVLSTEEDHSAERLPFTVPYTAPPPDQPFHWLNRISQHYAA